MNVGDEIRIIKSQLTNIGSRLASAAGISLHHATHESGGSDSIKLDDLATPDDNADLNASITRHGLLKKLDNDGTHYMDGQGNWTVPAGGGGANIEFLDNFDDAARHWGWFDDAKNGTIAEAASLLTLSIANGVNGRIDDGGQNSGPRVLLGDPGAPFEVKVKLNNYTINNYTHAGIFICSRCNPIAAGNWYMFGRARDGAVPVNGLGTWHNGNWVQTNAVTTLPIYLRFRIVVLSLSTCARCEAAYSTDDITYTLLDTFYLNLLTNFDTENLAIGIFARNDIWGGGQNAIAAPFEWFKMERTTGPG